MMKATKSCRQEFVESVITDSGKSLANRIVATTRTLGSRWGNDVMRSQHIEIMRQELAKRIKTSLRGD